ncbi:MAG: O-antigen ligase family protein [Robiginitomaculum sp.]|nr:O-antigen ligase family protein [Robiginitomaculum sp.]
MSYGGTLTGAPLDYGYDNIAARNRMGLRLLRWTEEIIVFVLLFQFSTALVALILTDPNDLASTSMLARNLWYPGYILVMLLTLRWLPKVVRMAVFNPLLVISVLWCGLSYIWSIEPDVTLRRSVALLMTTLFGLVLAARYDWNELVQRLALVFLVTAVISLVLAVGVPQLGQMQEIHQGAWRGAWLEKNSFGVRMAMGLALMMCAFAMQPKRWWLWVPGGVLCFGLVIMSTSKAALLAALVAILGFLVIRVFRRFPILRIPVMYGVVIGVGVMTFLLIFMPDMMFELIGKERTLTGRTDIWHALAQAIREKPLLGYGYGTFWNDLNGPSYWVRFSLEWGVPTAHNGWVETWLSAGIVAVVLFGLLYLITLLLAIGRLYKGGVENYWVILSTILFLMISLSESTILQQNDLSWVIFVATSAKLFAFSPAWWRYKPSS